MRSVLWLIAVLALPAAARPLLSLDAAHQPVALMDAGEAWIDADGVATAERVAADRAIAWLPTRDGAVYPIGAGKALWIRFTVLASPGPGAERWYLEIPYPSLDLAALYTAEAAGGWSAQAAGDRFAVASWPLPHRHPFLPVLASADGPRDYLLRVENSHAFSAPLEFISESHLNRREQRTFLVLGVYFGLVGLAVLLAIAAAVWLRDSAYGHYALSMTLMGLTQASMTGIAGLHLWPTLPWWNNMSPMVLPVLSVGALMVFFSAVLDLSERSLKLYQLLVGLACLSVVTVAGIITVDAAQRLTLMVPYIVIATGLGVAAIVWATRRGDRYGAWLLAGMLPGIVGAAFPLARVSGLIPVSFLTLHGMQIGLAIELPLLLLVLLLRSHQRQEWSRRIGGLDRLDPATGLINAQVFATQLADMVARSRRLHYQSAVLLVDIANVDQVRREFDQRSADELPLRVAGRLLSAARKIDSVARLSEFRFGMLVEGPLSPSDAAAAGPRVVARCLMPFKNKPAAWVARVRVAQLLAPLDGDDAAAIVQRLDAVLAGVPAHSKRAVFSVTANPSREDARQAAPRLSGSRPG